MKIINEQFCVATSELGSKALVGYQSREDMETLMLNNLSIHCCTRLLPSVLVFTVCNEDIQTMMDT